MNRLTVSTFAAAALIGLLSPAARADRAAFSLQAGGVGIILAADDGADGTGTSSPSPSETVKIEADPAPNPFIPDVYPSRAQAARAAAVAWTRIDPRRWDRPPARIRVMSDDQSLFVPVHEGIRSRVPNVRVEPCDGALCAGGSPPAGEAWLYVTLPAGAVSVRSAGWATHVAMVNYVDKPWVTNFADFVTRTPGRWVVGRSNPERPAGSAGEAAHLARVAAAREVTPLVTARMHGAHRYDSGRLAWLVEAQLNGDRLVHDRFPQKYERPYGSLYHEAVLIDASDANIERLSRDVRRSLDSERRSKVGGLAGAGAVLLVTYALYRFANAFTRGYFTWSLRTAAAVVAAAAVTLLAAVA